MGTETPCQRPARAERHSDLGQGISLCDLHAEVSAYRRQEQIFVSLAAEMLRFDQERAAAERDCVYLGPIGQPTWCGPAGGPSDFDCKRFVSGAKGVAMLPETAPQPSPDFASFTRV